jgi:hypothetical protein
MAPPGKAYAAYSNIMNVRTTPSELVFEFGNFFPEAQDQPPPAQFEPEIRVVMPIQTLMKLLDVLSQAAKSKTAKGSEIASESQESRPQ